MREESVSSMNISTHGVYFATDQKVKAGLLVQLHLKMPKEIVGDEVEEWSFTGRVAHVELLEPAEPKVWCGRAIPVLRGSAPSDEVAGYNSQPLRLSGATIF